MSTVHEPQFLRGVLVGDGGGAVPGLSFVAKGCRHHQDRQHN